MSHDDTADTGFGGALASRVLPRTRTIRRSPLSDRPGALAGRVVDFAASLAAPSLAQVGVEPSTLSDPSQQTVRPPIDNWLWGEAEAPEPEPAARAPWRPNGSSPRAARSASRKGLPLTTRRRQNTLGGARTAPGAIARTLLPNTDTSAPIEAPSVLRRSRRDAAATQQAVPARPRPAAASAARPAASSASEPAGLPSDLQRLQRMLIRDGLMQPRSPYDEPLVPPTSVQGSARPSAPAATPGRAAPSVPGSRAPSSPPEPGGGVRRAVPPTPSRGPGGPAGPGAATRPTPQASTPQDGIVRRTPDASPGREVADTAPRASSEGRIDRHTVSMSRARRAAAETTSGDPASALAARPSPFGPTASAADEAAVAPVAPPASPFAGPVTPARVAPDTAPSSSPEQTVRRDPIVRRNADLGRPAPAPPNAPARSESSPNPTPPVAPAPARPVTSEPSVLDRGTVDRVLAARSDRPATAPADAVVRRTPVAPVASRAADPVTAPATASSSTAASSTAAAGSTRPGDAVSVAETITTVPAAERPDTADLAVAPAASIAVAERPTAAPVDARRIETRDVDASPRPAEPAAAPAVARQAAPAPVTPTPPTPPRATPTVARDAAAAPATLTPPSAPRPDRSAPAGREGFVVRRLGEVADRPDTAALPVRPAVIGAQPDEPTARTAQSTLPVPGAPAAPAARVTAPSAPGAPTVRRSPEPTEPSPRPVDQMSTDRVTAADLGRLRARRPQPADARVAVTGDSRTSPVLPAAATPAGVAGGVGRAVPEGTVPPALPGSAAARSASAAAVTPASPASPDVVRRSIDQDAGDAVSARVTAPATARDLPAVRPPAAVTVAPATPTSSRPPAPSAPAPAAASITRGLLRRTLDAREPVRRRVAPLASAGLAAPMPVATDAASRASAIEAVMHADAGAGASPQPIAERFMSELSRQRAPRPRPLPEQFHEMSHAIAGTPQVRVSTDAISRRALRSVGKVAATVDDVIHLDRPIGSVRPDVIAHELTHVAHRSPEPRFFDDDRPSLEESRAEAVAKVMRSSAAPSIVRRSPTSGGGPSARTSDPGTVSADALAARIGSGDSNTIRREGDWAATRPRNERRGPQLGSARGASASTASTSSSSSASSSPAPSSAAPAPPVPVPVETASPSGGFRIEEHFDRIVELLQDRVIAELERRGGRLRGGF